MTTTKKTGRAGLFAKLLEAAREANAVDKRGQNTGQGYAYAQASDVIAEAQRALHTAGLVAFMVPGEIEEREIQAQSGQGGLFVTILSTLTIVDPDDPEHPLELTVKGTGVDYPGDKAIYKAMTGAAKYAYASALGIPFGDDPEADNAGSGQARKSRPTGDATPNQKRAITRILNRAGVPKEVQTVLVHDLAGDPVSFDGASAILDVITVDEALLEAAVDSLFDSAGDEAREARASGAANLPADTEPDPAPPAEDAPPADADPDVPGEGEDAAAPKDDELFPTDDEVKGTDEQD